MIGAGAIDPARPTPGMRTLVLASFLLTSAIAAAWQALSSTVQPTRALVWAALGLTAYAASLLCLVGGGQGRSFGLVQWRFGSWTLFWYGTAFGLASLTWIQPQTGSSAQITLNSVLRALWLVAVGMTLWTLGYLSGPGRPAQRLANRMTAAVNTRFTAEVRSPLAPWILYAIGTAARIASAVTTGLFGYIGNVRMAYTAPSGYGQLLTVLSACAPLAVSAAALQVYRDRVPGARVTLTVLFLAEITFGAAAGGKQSFIIAVLAVAIPFSMARRRIHMGLLVFGILALLLIVVPFNQAYRGVARNASGTLSASQALAAAPGILVQTVRAGDVTGTLGSSTAFLLGRIREIDSPAVIMQRTPSQIGFTSPVQLVTGPIATLVPRALWPGKPILDSGYQFSQRYYDLPTTVYTSSAITPAGDLYRHGGWIPVVLGMFLLGCGARLLDEAVDVRGHPHAIFLFVLLFPSLIKQEADWVGMLAGLPEILLVWLLTVYLTFRRRQRIARRL